MGKASKKTVGMVDPPTTSPNEDTAEWEMEESGAEASQARASYAMVAGRPAAPGPRPTPPGPPPPPTPTPTPSTRSPSRPGPSGTAQPKGAKDKQKRKRVRGDSESDSESGNEALAEQVANYKLMASMTASELVTATNRSSSLQSDLEAVQNSLEESCAINDGLRKREETLRNEHNEELKRQAAEIERLKEEQTKRLLLTHREQVERYENSRTNTKTEIFQF